MNSKKTYLFIWILLSLFGFFKSLECCTVGAVSGSVTQDGRPIIWKTGDGADNQKTIKYFDNENYSYVGVNIEGSTLPRMGVNEVGFSIVNNNPEDLEPPDTTWTREGMPPL